MWGIIPLLFARIICQQTNARWDSDLRRRYRFIVIILVVTLFLIAFGIGWVGEITLEKFMFSIIVPFSPAFLWGIREYIRQGETAEKLKRIKEHLDDLWDKAIKNEISSEKVERKSRAIQNALYDHRHSCPMIFDWIYKLFYGKSQKRADEIAEEMVEEFLLVSKGGPVDQENIQCAKK